MPGQSAIDAVSTPERARTKIIGRAVPFNSCLPGDPGRVDGVSKSVPPIFRSIGIRMNRPDHLLSGFFAGPVIQQPVAHAASG